MAASSLGWCLLGEGHRAEAEPLLRDSAAALAAMLGPNDPRSREAAGRAAALDRGRPAKRPPGQAGR